MSKERITWRDWQPTGTPDPDELLTRVEFVSCMNDLGIDVDVRALLYWERLGTLPRGVRKRVNKATYVFYPRWLMRSVARLRRLQGSGMSLDQIGPRLREMAADDCQMSDEDLAWVSTQRDRILDTIGRPGEAMTLDEAIDLARAANYDVHITITSCA